MKPLVRPGEAAWLVDQCPVRLDHAAQNRDFLGCGMPRRQPGRQPLDDPAHLIPCASNRFSASRTGVRLTPKRSASSVSISREPPGSSPPSMASRINW
jgi:hypothetical protein